MKAKSETDNEMEISKYAKILLHGISNRSSTYWPFLHHSVDNLPISPSLKKVK